MSDTSPPAAPPVPFLLYDGDCAFCQRCVDVGRGLLRLRFECAPFQFLDLAELGLTAHQAADAVWWIEGRTPLGGTGYRSGAAAVAGLLSAQRAAPWRAAGWILDHRPINTLAGPIYRLIARNRYRLPGGTASCRIPDADSKLPPRNR